MGRGGVEAQRLKEHSGWYFRGYACVRLWGGGGGGLWHLPTRSATACLHFVGVFLNGWVHKEAPKVLDKFVPGVWEVDTYVHVTSKRACSIKRSRERHAPPPHSWGYSPRIPQRLCGAPQSRRGVHRATHARCRPGGRRVPPPGKGQKFRARLRLHRGGGGRPSEPLPGGVPLNRPS